MNPNKWSLKNAKYQSVFDKNGIVATIKVDSADLTKLNEIFDKNHSNLDDGYFHRFHVGIHSNDLEYKRGLHKSISEILDPYYDALFDNYRRLIYTMQIKGTV
jgi:hypothetical protein